MCVFVLVNFMTISSILTAATAAWTLFVVVPVVVPCTNRQKEYMIASATQTWEEMNCGFGHQLVAGSALDRLQNCTGSSLHTCNTRSLSPRLQFSSKDRQDWCGIFSEMVKRESPTLPCVSFLWSLSPSHLISLSSGLWSLHFLVDPSISDFFTCRRDWQYWYDRKHSKLLLESGGKWISEVDHHFCYLRSKVAKGSFVHFMEVTNL